jgi:hypothetical protein
MTLQAALISRGGDFISVIPPEVVHQIIYHQRGKDSQVSLRNWHREKVHVSCGCRCAMHVVQRKARFHLRRNPRRKGESNGEDLQLKPRLECDLCRTVRERQRSRESLIKHLTRPVMLTGLILHSRKVREGDLSREPRKGGGRGGRGRRERYASGYAHMLGVWERCGFTRYAPDTPADGSLSLEGNIRWSELWERVDQELAKTEFWEAARSVNNTCDYFAWMPGGRHRGGLVEVNRRLLTDWRHPEFEPEAQIWTMLDEVPKSGTIMIPRMTARMSEKQRMEGKMPLEPYELDVPRHAVGVIGGTPPYLALAVASDNHDGDLKYAKPVAHRLLLYAIAASAFPVPVESSHERNVAFHLRDIQVAFAKPVFDDGEGLRPDFELPEQKVLIEVQGMNRDEYREKKEETHRRLMACERYRDWRLVRYDPNEGERLEEFKRKLEAALR